MASPSSGVYTVRVGRLHRTELSLVYADRKFSHMQGSRRLKIEPGNQPILLVFLAGCLGMIPMTMIGKVRRMFHRQNKSVREIARLTKPP
jgi:hypothetical protein